jgi:hypothetical protein
MGGLGFPLGPTTYPLSPHYINPRWGTLAHSFPPLPLFLLAWLPRLELCQWVEEKPPIPDAVALPDFQLNPPSSAALLEWSSDDVYTPYVCNPSRALHVRRYFSSTGTTTRP